MTTSKATSTYQQKLLGDAAVDGLLAGIGAGLVMALFLLLIGLLNGDLATAVFGRFDPGQNQQWLTGLVIHLAVSSIYGIVFGLLFRVLIRIRPSWARFSWLPGLAYGLILYGVVQTALATGIDSGLVQFTAVILLLAHAIYGLVLGIILGRK